MENRTILLGDCKERLKEIDDNSIDLICTDPPYGYGFMNKDWDKVVVSVDIWKECLRVLKPGAFAFIMSAPRQDVLSHMIVNITDAGFNTGFTSMYWAYASGFPKAMNISKAVDKKLGVDPQKVSNSQNEFYFENLGKAGYKENFDITKPSSPQAKRLDGSYAGYQPKPAVEVILVCMKPLSEKNYVSQVMKNGKGITWLDDCRIPYQNKDDLWNSQTDVNSSQADHKWGMKNDHPIIPNDKGRFPANLIVSDNALDVGKKTKSKRNLMKPDEGGTGNSLSFRDEMTEERGYDDEGDFSRYYSLDQWESQFIITPKPSKSEKNDGLDKFMSNSDKYGGKFPCSKKLSTKKVNDGRTKPVDNPYQRGETIRQNTHPTVKPVSLFKYLVTLGSRPNDFVLDPFMGSGTTAIACEKLARNWIGIEMNPEYKNIIEARIDDYKKQERLFNA